MVTGAPAYECSYIEATSELPEIWYIDIIGVSLVSEHSTTITLCASAVPFYMDLPALVSCHLDPLLVRRWICFTKGLETIQN